MRIGSRRSVVLVLWAVAALAVCLPLLAQSAGKHCVTSLAPLEPGARQSKVLGRECYSSFPEAVWHATGGRVNLSEADDFKTQLATLERELKADGRLEAKGLQEKATFVIAIDYDAVNYGGSTAMFNGSSACSSTTSYGVTTMPAGWDNAADSTKAFSNCNNNQAYENASYGGANRICTPDCADLGVLKNAVSSQRWYF